MGGSLKGAGNGRRRRLRWRKDRSARLFRWKRFFGFLRFCRPPRPPKLPVPSQQPPECPAVGRPCRQASRAALCPALPPAEPPPLRIAGCPFPAGRLPPASDGLGLPPPNRPRVPRTTGLAVATPSSGRSPPAGASVPTSQALVRSGSPTPPLGRSARPPGPRRQPPSAPLFRSPHLGEEPRPEGAVRSQSCCKWHLELATSQRIFT